MTSSFSARSLCLFSLGVALFFSQLSCGSIQDYDVEEIAPTEHLSSYPHPEHDHEHDEECGHDLEEEQDGAIGSASERHVHEGGERNHGTEWFFNQPWAASFIWPKMLRDSLVLAVLAALIYFLSRRVTRRT